MGLKTLRALREQPKPDGWLWYGYLMPGATTMLAAYPRVGKTTLIFPLIAAMMREEEFLGLPTKRPRAILYVSEEPDSLIVPRADSCGFDDSWPIAWQLVEPGMTWARIVAMMAMPAIELVIIDSLSKFWQLPSEDSSGPVNEALAPMLDIVRTQNKSVFLIHHTNKGGGPGGTGIRGSSALMATIDIPFELTRMHPWDTSGRRRLQSYSRYGETPNLLHLDYSELTGWQAIDEDAASVEGGIMEALESEEGATQNELSEIAGVGVARISTVLGQMSSRGIVIRSGTGGKKSPFIYRLAGAAQ